MIDRLITVLQRAGLILSDQELASLSEAESLLNDEDLADAIWLALKITTREEPVVEDTDSNQPDGSPPPVVIETVEGQSSPAPPVSVYLPESGGQESATKPSTDAPESGLPILVQAASALQDARSLARSLRPLMRKAPSRTQRILDEGATVDRIAQQRVWVPVLKPAPERWLDLELVIESSQFSFIWQEALDEFQQILERQGAFRNVRVWRVQGVEQGRLQLVPKQKSPTNQTSRSPRELIDAAGRRLLLYVSDCRSPVWQQGKIHQWLKLWSQHGPTAIAQLLPERLWSESELDVGVGVQVSATMPGAINSKLIVRDAADFGVDPSQSLTLPVMTLTASSLRQLALVVAAMGGQRAPARLFDLSWVTDPEREPAPAVIHPQTAAERVELFLATASPMAQKLACMMAAVPVSLPVVHLIQERLLKGSTPTHVAEVYSSSLLKVVQQASGDEAVQYDFFPEVRQLLNERTPQDETLDVLQELSQVIVSTLGLPPIKSFAALLSPKSYWNQETRAAILPFAQVATQVLYNLGGNFASLAAQVKRDAAQKPNWIQPVDYPPVFPELQDLEFIMAQLVDPTTEDPFPLLQTQEVEVVTLVVEDDSPPPALELQPFEFEVATLEYQSDQQTGNLFPAQQSQWVIRKQRQRRVGLLVEPLGDNVSLEMVLIPGGTFLMGSPEDELDRLNREGPQHEVQVREFLMGRYPVTQAQWRAVARMPQINRELKRTPSQFKGEKRPVERVSWLDAVEFCDRLSAHTGRTYQLPTEAEWEYACRAGTVTPFHFGETITTDLANYDGNYTYNDGPKGKYEGKTTPVDRFKVANAFGLCDMHGNVWEWCLDHYHDSYVGVPTDGSAWLSEDENSRRVARGGSWLNSPWECRSAYRAYDPPDCRGYSVGFRICCSAPRTL